MEADVLEVGVEAKAGAQARVEWRRRQMEAGAGRGGGWVGDQAEAEAGWGEAVAGRTLDVADDILFVARVLRGWMEDG